uniref:RING-type E3 ubiquitin transferase n=2 Tax=Knipowitschia caucasica TaxID=637954 RepID=A0AAV2JBM9_KNICA
MDTTGLNQRYQDNSHRTIAPDNWSEPKVLRRNYFSHKFTHDLDSGMFDLWDKISATDKLKAGHHMKICSYWLPILLQRDQSKDVTTWAICMGLVEPNKDVTLKHIDKIEILEAILRAMVTGTIKKAQTKRIIVLSNCFHMQSPEVLENALQWLEGTGEPNIRSRVLELGHLDVCITLLAFVFMEFSQYVKDMSERFRLVMHSLTALPSEDIIKKCEEMKTLGNKYFQKKQYEEAVKYYTKASKLYPENHIIYGNRALCYIRSNNFIKALGDGKLATLISPDWPKGHYRYCEALFGLGEVRRALQANVQAQALCKDSSEGIKDLEAQHQKFSTHPSLTNARPKTTASQRPNVTNNLKPASAPVGRRASPSRAAQSPIRSQAPPNRERQSAAPPSAAEKTAPVRKEPEAKVEDKAQQNKSAATPGTPDSKAAKSGRSSAQGRAESTSKGHEAKSAKSEQKKHMADLSKELTAEVKDAHTALDDLRNRNAEQAFSRALALLGSGTSTQVPGVSSLDVLLLQYGRAKALIQIGRPEELSEAVQLLNQIQASEERTFQCLVCLGFGLACVKENRFVAALTHFSDAVQMVKNKIIPGKLTWPTTTHVVPETQVDCLLNILEESIQVCKFPPSPNGVCRYNEQCVGYSKKEIYFTDPDFKGFIQLHCCHSCRLEYHISCWKSLKSMVFSEKSEKDCLKDPCLTPDCSGLINQIKIYGPTGLVKCKFDVAIPKPVSPRKLAFKQTCTSLKKLKSKEERHVKRKQYKQTAEQAEGGSSETAQLQPSPKTPPRARLHFRDHVLLQISQNMEVLRQESSTCVSALGCRLRPWLQLDLYRGSDVAQRLLLCLEEPAATLGAAVELLLEGRNRVWARLLIQALSEAVDLQPRVSGWAQRLDRAGLSAAPSFLEQYYEELEQLDLSLLLHFSPVRRILMEKLDSQPELISSLGVTLTEYLLQSPPQDIRLFIWALDEHRHHYTSCHSILDQYFDLMDGHCSVLKKPEDNDLSSPSKSKHRVKKKKCPKAFPLFPNPLEGAAADNWDSGLLEDDSLNFLEEPFSVPPHLRHLLTDFEDPYRSRNNGSPTNQASAAPPPLSTAVLYEYFKQILEKHGPLAADYPLLIGEIKNFPVVAQQKIHAAGGLEAFLLSSPVFTKIGSNIGLARAEATDSLDQLDDFLDANSSLYDATFYNRLRETCPNLPCPPVFDLYTDPSAPEPPSPPVASSSRPTDPQGASPDQPPVQDSPEPRVIPVEQSCVAVNTEAIPGFEISQGALIVLMKQQQDMQQQINSTDEQREKRRQQRAEELQALKEELDQSLSFMQVTQQELGLFQNKLEEELKRDQKDKKEHQEQMRAMKQEVEALHQEQQRLKRSISVKKSARETQLQDFIKLSNQSAAEKLRLEEELKRCKDAAAKASKRSYAAQLRVLHEGPEQSGLHRDRLPPHSLDPSLARLKGSQDIEKKISNIQAHYKRQMEEVKSGSRQSEQQSVSEEPAPVQLPEAAAAPPTAPPAGASASPVKKKLNQRKAQEGPAPTVFERALESLEAIFPDTRRSELTGHIQRFRSSNGGLQSLGLQDVVSGVTQLILDQQEERNRSRAHSAQTSAASSSAQLAAAASAWQHLEPLRAPHVNALNSEDPCIICHDDMSEEDTCVLECRHSFHHECIRSWLKEQSTCPTCREHTLLQEDFPALSSKRHI